MRWRDTPPPTPRAAETRVRHVFAWRPTKVGAYTVWLESYAIFETYFTPASGNPGWWSESNRTLLP